VNKRFSLLLVTAWVAVIPLAVQSQPKAKARITVADLMTPSRSHSLIGREVTLWYQPIQIKTGSSAIWIGPNQNRMVLVAIPPSVHPLDTDGEPVKLDEGDYVQVHALVVRAPNDYQLRKGWGVNSDDLFLAQQAGIILMADDIKLMAQHD
jgi:hypothetical protein